MLLGLEVMLTFTIAANASLVVSSIYELTTNPSGVSDDAIGLVDIEEDIQTTALAGSDDDLARLRSFPGIIAAARVDATPFGSDAVDTVFATPDDLSRDTGVSATQYEGGPAELDVLGAELVSGRDFGADEYDDTELVSHSVPHTTILTEALAMRLFGSTHAVGKHLYLQSGDALLVVGIVRNLTRPHPIENAGKENFYSMFLPATPTSGKITLAFRTQPSSVERVLVEIGKELGQAEHAHSISSLRTLQGEKEDYFRKDSQDSEVLCVATLALALVTALGIGGLATFWVRQRRRSVAICRSVGATRQQVILWLLAENALIVGSATLCGIALAIVLNAFLMHHFEMTALDVRTLALGAVLMLGLGQVSVLGPALRAASIEPAGALKLR
jgi:putative ABC transport system permease protein